MYDYFSTYLLVTLCTLNKFTAVHFNAISSRTLDNSYSYALETVKIFSVAINSDRKVLGGEGRRSEACNNCTSFVSDK